MRAMVAVLMSVTAIMAVAGCTQSGETEWAPLPCVPNPDARPAGHVIPVAPFGERPEQLARRFTKAVGVTMGSEIESDADDASRWNIGRGWVSVAMEGDIIQYELDKEWPATEGGAARREVERFLVAFGLEPETLNLTVASDGPKMVTVYGAQRLPWPSAEPLRFHSERFGDRTGPGGRASGSFSAPLDVSRVGSIIAPIEAQAIVRDFEACRLEAPSITNADIHAGEPLAMPEGLVYRVFHQTSPGFPASGGGSIHGCPPTGFDVSVDAETGAVLGWKDRGMCL